MRRAAFLRGIIVTLVLCAFTLVLTTCSSGPEWHIVFVDSTGDVGGYTSLAVVNGNPAISYGDDTNGYLKFAVCY